MWCWKTTATETQWVRTISLSFKCVHCDAFFLKSLVGLVLVFCGSKSLNPFLGTRHDTRATAPKMEGPLSWVTWASTLWNFRSHIFVSLERPWSTNIWAWFLGWFF
jgi:hypothetical protein